MATEEGSQTQDEIIRKAMMDMGWDPQAEIPMASKENLCILAEMEQMVEEKIQMLESNIQTEDRLEKLLQHSKNAEMCVNQNLVSSWAIYVSKMILSDMRCF